MNIEKSHSLATVANATELAAAVVQRVAGEEVSTHVGGKRFTDADLKHAIAAKLQSGLIAEGGKKQ